MQKHIVYTAKMKNRDYITSLVIDIRRLEGENLAQWTKAMEYRWPNRCKQHWGKGKGEACEGLVVPRGVLGGDFKLVAVAKPGTYLHELKENGSLLCI